MNSLHYLQYCLGLTKPRTETSAPERDALRRHARGRRRLVEIGVFQGVNSRNFREVMAADGVLLAIDPYCRSFFGIRGFGWARRIAHHEVGRVRNGQVCWIEDRGENAPRRTDVAVWLPVDFVFIDGDHTYDGLRGDWESWSGHIALQGIVALHDSRHRNGVGSERFTQEVIRHDSRFELLEEIDSLTILKRVQ